MIRILTGLLLVPAILFYSHSADATTWHVTPDGMGDAPTIQAGIDSAAAGDTVLVHCGVYFEHDVEMKSDICLRSETGRPACATIDAQGLGRVVRCINVDSTAAIEGLTITGGLAVGGYFNSDSSGAGVLCSLSSPSITRCTIRDNHAPDEGGGIAIHGGAPDMSQCLIEQNTAHDGGGMYCNWAGVNSDPVLFEVQFVSNEAVNSGGGLSSYYSSPEMTSVEFRENSAGSGGGGMLCFTYCRSVMTDVLFIGNHAAYGGGFCCSETYFDYNSPTLERVTFVGNTATSVGGGMYLTGYTYPTANHCLLYDNTSPNGSGIHFYNSKPIINNTIVAYNNGGAGVACGGPWVLPEFYCCDIYGNEGGDMLCGINGGGNFSADPLFCDAPGLDFTLDLASPCVGASACGLVGPFGIGCDGITGMEDRAPSFPNRPTIQLISPNPFNPSTTIRFSLVEAGRVDLAIYSAGGRRVAAIAAGHRDAGEHRAVWNGTDDERRPAPSGVYFCRLETGGDCVTKKMVLIR